MKHFSAIVLLTCLTATAAHGQSYCSPIFPNGCFGWHSQSISIGSLDWVFDGIDCTASDYTNLSATVNAGDPVAMNVVAGVWCGAAVWVDFDNSYSFEDTENLYYIYVGGDPSYTYDFTIPVPAGTPTGSYRLRVVTPWGSDGFLSSNTNGYGPCGDYQYGNFIDFTLNVIGATGIDQLNTPITSPIIAGPNPTNGQVTLTSSAAAPMERVTVWSADGRAVEQLSINASSGKIQLDLSHLPNGVYLLQCMSDDASSIVRVMKQ